MAKEPWVAVILSLTVPGTGQIYANRIRRGIVVHVLTLSPMAFIISQVTDANGDIRLALAGGIAIVPLWLFNVFDAHRCARQASDPEFNSIRKKTKDPWLAILLSYFFPGLGHFYLKRWGVGIAWLLGALLLTWFVNRYGKNMMPEVLLIHLSGALFLAYGLVAGFCAYATAPIRREKSLGLVFGILALLFINSIAMRATLFYVRQFVVEPFVISSGSMAPTLLSGDRIVVKKSFGPLRRNDIIVFVSPVNSEIWLKRVAAVADETIEIRADGRVYVNDKMLDTPPYDHSRFPMAPLVGTVACDGPHRVDRDSVFVLGDHGEKSLDSRKFGDLRLSSVRGLAYRIWFPLSRVGPIGTTP